MEFVAAFCEVDCNHDNVISGDDLDNYSQKMGYTTKFTQKWLLLFDTNKDGIISLAEFCQALGLKLDEVEQQIAAKRAADEEDAILLEEKNKQEENMDEDIDDIEEEVITTKKTIRVNAALPPPAAVKAEESKLSEVVIYENDCQTKDSDHIIELGTEAVRLHGEFPTRMVEHMEPRLDKRFGKQWHVLHNPMEDSNTVEYKKGCMLNFRVNEDNRFLVWRKQSKCGCCNFLCI